MKTKWIGILSSIALAMGITAVQAEETTVSPQPVEQQAVTAPSEEALAVLGDAVTEEAVALTEQEMAETTGAWRFGHGQPPWSQGR